MATSHEGGRSDIHMTRNKVTGHIENSDEKAVIVICSVEIVGVAFKSQKKFCRVFVTKIRVNSN